MSTQLSPEMSLLLSKMTDQLNIQTNTITENITAAVLQKVDEKILPIIEENKRLKGEIEKLSTKIQNLETNSKRKNIILHGLPESNEETHEDLTTLVTSTMKEIDVQLEYGEIDRLQRLGKKVNEESKTRPILLTTTTLQKKIQILKNKKKMKQNTYITHDLTKAELQLKKEKRHMDIKENEKRKRSETPSPGTSNAKQNTPKMQRKNAFQFMRERAYSLSDKNTYRN
ncbi:uncharacterized protein LOC123878640 [Maniola jurtina]|uniref:uncharacterized protein LOC123878640 n=1 Tax=Maniola jurtina TaxID=191418 RepID=UPI001E68DB48|nr:uncharacterized protein LOC123878640 [Maniola jurtina]